MFALTNIKITGKENCADQEAADKFQVFIKTITKEKGQLPKINFLTFIEIQVIYNVVLISAVQQTVTPLYAFFFLFFYIYGLPQDIGSSSPCYAAGSSAYPFYI